MPIMMSQILKSGDFTKTQKSRYFENEALFFLQIKNIKGYFIAKNNFVSEVTLKILSFAKHYLKPESAPLMSLIILSFITSFSFIV